MILLDTSFLLASAFTKDINHHKAREARRALPLSTIILAPVMHELFHMMASRVDYPRAVDLLERLQTASFTVEQLTYQDMQRMVTIMREYPEAKFDYVDCAIMSVAERLQITSIYTFDRRDFGMFRPKHVSHFTLLPS